MPSEKRKAKRQQYLNAAKKSRKYANGMVLKEDMKGFLLTCNNREKETVREGYNLLNEYADKIFGPEMKESNLDDDDDDEDIDAALDKEKASLQAANDKPKTERRFQQVESGANNCIFIKTAIEAPGKLVEEIVNDLHKTKVQKCRFIMRMLPILGTCKAYEKNIEELAQSVIPPFVKDEDDRTFCVLFKTRNTNQVSREEVFKIIGAVMRGLGEEWRVDLTSPGVCVVVEVIRTICCIGVVRNFYDRKKYNLVELVKPDVDPEDQKTESHNPESKTESTDGLLKEDSTPETESKDESAVQVETKNL